MALSWESKNSLPMEKAMNPRAVFVITDRPSTSSGVVKPIPSTPSCPRQWGPTIRPAIKNAVTSGRCSFMSLNTRVISRPMSKDRAAASMVCIIDTSHSNKAVS